MVEHIQLIPHICHFLQGQNFWRINFTLKKRINYDKIHSKLPIFCVKFTPAKKNLHGHVRGDRDKYQVCVEAEVNVYN